MTTAGANTVDDRFIEIGSDQADLMAPGAPRQAHRRAHDARAEDGDDAHAILQPYGHSSPQRKLGAPDEPHALAISCGPNFLRGCQLSLT